MLPRHAAIGPGRQLAKGLRLAGLIPEGDAADEIGPLQVERFRILFAVPLVFDRHAKRLVESDRIEHVPAIARGTVAGLLALRSRRAEPVARARPKPPGVVEIVLAAGSLKARHFFAVDVEVVVPLAEPAGLGVRDAHHRADVLAAAGQVGNEIIAGLGRILLPVFRVEVGDVLRQPIDLDPVDLPVQARAAVGIVVADDDSRRLGERHPPEAGQRAGGRNLDGKTLDHRRFALSDGEEIGQRRLDGGLFSPVPVNVNAQSVQLVGPAGVTGHPYMRDDAGPFSSGTSTASPGCSQVMSMLPLCQFGCSLLETRRLRPIGGEVRAPSGSRDSRPRPAAALESPAAAFRATASGRAALACPGIIDPNRVVHVRFRVLVGQHAAAEWAAGVADEKDASARLPRVVAIADQQHAMAVLNLVAWAHLQHAVVPIRCAFSSARESRRRPAIAAQSSA